MEWTILGDGIYNGMGMVVIIHRDRGGRVGSNILGHLTEVEVSRLKGRVTSEHG